MTRNKRVCRLNVIIVAMGLGLASWLSSTCNAQVDCPSNGAPAAPVVTPSVPSAPTSPGGTASAAPTSVTPLPIPTTNVGRALSRNSYSRNSGNGLDMVNAYFQSLQTAAPMMPTDLASQQAAVVAQQQARTAVRRAQREPARARMREENAQRYYLAGRKAESSGNYVAARKYYRRAASVDGGECSENARQALASITE